MPRRIEDIDSDIQAYTNGISTNNQAIATNNASLNDPHTLSSTRAILNSLNQALQRDIMEWQGKLAELQKERVAAVAAQGSDDKQ